MTNKFRTLVLGAALGLGTLAFSGATVSAAAMLPLAQSALSETNAANTGIVEIKHKRKRNKWNNDWNFRNNRCFDSYYGCRYNRSHYRNGVFLNLPLIIGGGFAAQDYYDNNDNGYGNDVYYEGGGNSHVQWCLNRYRSYNPRTNTWLSYSGQFRQCYSPYM